MKRSIFLFLILILQFSCSTRKLLTDQSEKPSLPEFVDEIPLDPLNHYGTLENGFNYIIRKNQKPANRAELRLVINAGSILETPEQKGLAHFCEHMAFNGTKHFEKMALVDYLESIGMRFGPEINAYTNFDETVYMLEVPTDSTAILETAFQILEDWAHLISFNPEEIEKERGVILEEWRLGRGANARIRDKQLPVLLYGSRYAERLPIGDPAIITSFSHQLLTDFYHDWYRPDLMTLIAVGDFNPEFIEKQIQIHFAPIPISEPKSKRDIFPVPDHADIKISIVSDPEATHNRLSLYFKYDRKEEQTVSDYQKSVTETIYDSMLNDRLDELLRSDRPPYLAAYAGVEDLTRSKGSYFIGCITEDGGLIRGLETLLIESRRVREHGFTSTELERTKLKILRFIDKAYHERDKTESSRYASEFVRHVTNNEPIPGIEYEFQFFNTVIPRITLKEINALNTQFMRDSNLVILVSTPEKSDLFLPEEKDLLQVLEEISIPVIAPYIDKVSEEPLVTSVVVPGHIKQIVSIDTLGVTEWMMSNGVKIILKPTDFKNDQILFRGFSPGGTSLAPDSLSTAAGTASTIIRESGIGTDDKTVLDKRLAGKIVSVTPFISGLTEGISGQSSPRDIETMFQLIYLYFTAPRLDSTAFLSYKERMHGLLENRTAKPESAYQDTIQVTMSDYHFRMRPWTEAMLNEMNLSASFDFYKDRFADASDFTFIFVGNFTVETIRPFIEKYIASLPETGRNETFRDLNIVPPSGFIEKSVFRGLEPKSTVTLIYTGDVEWTPDRAHDFNSLIDILEIRLRETVREAMSGTYGVSISGSLSKIPKENYEINIAFGCDPARVEKLTAAVFLQIDTLITHGPREKDLQKVIETQKRTYETNMKKNDYWLSRLYGAELYGLDLTSILNTHEQIHTLNPGDIQKMAETCFLTGNRARFILYPEPAHPSSSEIQK